MRPRRVSDVDTDIMHGYIPQGYIHDNPWCPIFLSAARQVRRWYHTVHWDLWRSISTVVVVLSSLSDLLLLVFLVSPASKGRTGPPPYEWVYSLFEKDLEYATSTCRPHVVPLHPPQRHESSSKLPMSTFPSLAGIFVSAEEALNGDDPVALGSHGDNGSSVQWPDSHSSGILDFCASVAADAVPSVVLPDGADDGGGSGRDGCESVPAASQPESNKRRGGGAAGMGARPEGTGIRTRGCQDKYPISWATVIANKTTIFDIYLRQQLGILT